MYNNTMDETNHRLNTTDEPNTMNQESNTMDFLSKIMDWLDKSNPSTKSLTHDITQVWMNPMCERLGAQVKGQMLTHVWWA